MFEVQIQAIEKKLNAHLMPSAKFKHQACAMYIKHQLLNNTVTSISGPRVYSILDDGDKPLLLRSYKTNMLKFFPLESSERRATSSTDSQVDTHLSWTQLGSFAKRKRIEKMEKAANLIKRAYKKYTYQVVRYDDIVETTLVNKLKALNIHFTGGYNREKYRVDGVLPLTPEVAIPDEVAQLKHLGINYAFHTVRLNNNEFRALRVKNINGHNAEKVNKIR